MSQRFEGHFKGFDQTELFFQTWTPEKVRGAMLLTHGMSEHSECYNSLANKLADDGWQVFAWDLRGHGRSEGKRGYARHTDDFLDDLEVFHQVVRKQMKGHDQRPLVFFGHSLGGLLTLRYLQTRQPEYSALTLSSPALGLTVNVPKFKEVLANIAVKWFPKITLYNEVKYEDLTADADILKSLYADTLRHDKISPGLFLSMVENFALAHNSANLIDKPVLMQVSGEDRIVSAEASREFFEKLSNKKNQLLMYHDSLHEVFNDRERDQATTDLKKFINHFLGA